MARSPADRGGEDMTGMYGADVAQLRQLAAQFEQHASRLDADRMTVGSAIQISAWVGPVAVRFRHEWDSSHSRRVHGAAVSLREAASALRRNADDQDRASAADGGASGAQAWIQSLLRGDSTPQSLLADLRLRFPEFSTAEIVEFLVEDVVRGGADWLSSSVDLASKVVDWKTGTDLDLWDVMPGGHWISTAFKGIGIGGAVADFANELRDHDWSGAMLIGADQGLSYVPGASVLWTPMKAMTSFFYPLDQEAMDEQFAWLAGQGYSPQQIADRYSGWQGYVQVGNDHVRMHAPWLVDGANALLARPAEWLYNMGVKLY